MKKYISILVLVIVALLLIGWSRGTFRTSNEPIDLGQEWHKGNPEAKVQLIEYSDFQCPSCAFYEPIVQQLITDLEDQIYFTYRHFPLRSIHFNADLAARAAEAAGVQKKFWEMHDLLFENQSEWANNDARKHFEGYALELNLDLDQFNKDIDSNEIKDKVKNQEKSALSMGALGTPTFFVNGDMISPNPQTLDEFKLIINQYQEK
jgi:protein-disulfide isomerase